MVFKNLRLDELYRETGINKRVLFDTLKPSDKTTPGSGSLFPANIERKSRLFPEEYVKYNSSCSYMQDLREFLEFRNICIARERDLYLYNAKFVPPPKNINELRKLEEKLISNGYKRLRPKRTLLGLTTVISGLLENSFVHGNKKLSEVRLIIDEGSKGHLITIEDNGDGFNYSSVIGWLRGAGKERHNKIRTIRLADSLDFITKIQVILYILNILELKK